MPPHPDASSGSSRKFPKILLIAAAALLVARVGTGIWEERNSGGPATGAQTGEQREHVQWQPIAVAEAEARARRAPIFYDFSAEWCGPCKLMSTEVFADANAARQINEQFVPVRVVDRAREDGRNAPEVQALQDRFKIEAFPTIVLYSPATGRHESITGYGGRDGMLMQLARATSRVNGTATSERDSVE